jgi:hypothetical protein
MNRPTTHVAGPEDLANLDYSVISDDSVLAPIYSELNGDEEQTRIFGAEPSLGYYQAVARERLQQIDDDAIALHRAYRIGEGEHPIAAPQQERDALIQDSIGMLSRSSIRPECLPDADPRFFGLALHESVLSDIQIGASPNVDLTGFSPDTLTSFIVQDAATHSTGEVIAHAYFPPRPGEYRYHVEVRRNDDEVVFLVEPLQS